ncbi:UNVERIFIED_ORG: hypothetical protein LHJ69_12870 [Shinella sp. XGS7]|nr:hypothetical protein [Shinella sp. XGS7]
MLGSVIRANTAAGQNGAGILYNDVDGAGDDAKEFRALILGGAPAGAVFFEDGSFDIPAGTANGVYPVSYRLYVDGEDLGTTTATITLGPVSSAIQGSLAVRESGGDTFVATGALVSQPGAITGALLVRETGMDGFQASGQLQVVEPVVEWPYLGPEPVTISEAKVAARMDLDPSPLDAQLALLITAAREEAEHLTGRLYRSAVVRHELADWPSARQVFPVMNAWGCTISTWSGGSWVALDPARYAFGPSGIGGNGTGVLPIDGRWPELAPRPIGPRVRIDFRAGPVVTGAVPTVPGCVKLFILAHATAWLRNPEALASRSIAANPMFERLLDRELTYS